jgi:predicted transposase YdaD
MSGVFETFAEEIDKEAYTKYMAEGISIGKEQGISIGKEQGISIAGQTFARRLLEDGFSIEDIARYTALSPEAVRALAERPE